MTQLPAIANPTRKPYPSDLSDAEWEVLRVLIPKPKGFGHPVEVNFREMLNGIFYVQRTGCQWEMLPHDLPPYSTVSFYFRKWQRKGGWQQMHDQIHVKLRTHLRREEDASVAIADSQSVKTTEKRGRCTDLMVARRLKGVSVISS
jgi:putative transposase